MDHILLGTNEDDLALLYRCAVDAPQSTTWILPKRARPGDTALFFVPAAGIVGRGVVRAEPEVAMFRARQTYRGAVGAIELLAAPVPVAFLRDALPDWGWPRYPRTYTSLEADLAERVGRVLAAYQSDLGNSSQSAPSLVEGSVGHRSAIVFERNPEARAACIRHHGTSCAACDFAFGAAYGAGFEGFMHVHHLTPLATVRDEYVVDPVRDLTPLCPNCHAVAHRREPPFSLAELCAFLQSCARGGEA